MEPPSPFLRNHCRSSGALVSPIRWQHTNSLVVSAETVDSGFDKNEPELRVFVFSVAFKMLANSDSLVDDVLAWNVVRRRGFEKLLAI